MQTTLNEVMPSCLQIYVKLQEGETCVCKNIAGWQGKNEERGPRIPVPVCAISYKFLQIHLNSYTE